MFAENAPKWFLKITFILMTCMFLIDLYVITFEVMKNKLAFGSFGFIVDSLILCFYLMFIFYSLKNL
jgi:hypothetical protein